jgi:DNA-binding response OmpR family regulator
MRKDRILWADDEMDLLSPYILFLEEKGYEVATATNGKDAVELCQKETFDIIFLDENMPGLSGLETLALIKEIDPNVPLVMITKSEEYGNWQ